MPKRRREAAANRVVSRVRVSRVVAWNAPRMHASLGGNGTTWEGAGARSDYDAAIFAREVGVRANGLGWLEPPARRAALEADGCTEDEVLEATADGAIRRKAQSKGNLCSRCWHDCASGV
eukprot:scaffold141440_cov136-Phaeocystis_antarctica.AAC.2